MHFYRRKISGIFTESYAKTRYGVFLEVNNRLRKPGAANEGSSETRRAWSSKLIS